MAYVSDKDNTFVVECKCWPRKIANINKVIYLQFVKCLLQCSYKSLIYMFF